VAELHSALERVTQAHVFGKGMGIAVPRSASIALLPLFAVRGKVPRPLRIQVEHQHGTAAAASPGSTLAKCR
jgi:hypothetical protein